MVGPLGAAGPVGDPVYVTNSRVMEPPLIDWTRIFAKLPPLDEAAITSLAAGVIGLTEIILAKETNSREKQRLRKARHLRQGGCLADPVRR